MSQLDNAYVGNENSSMSAEEAPKFIIVKDGYGVEHKVIDLNDKNFVRSEGIIHLTPVIKTKRHRPMVTYSRWQDPMTGIIYGIFIGVNNKTKELMFQSILLQDDETFDLRNVMDAKKWAILRFAPFLKGSPNWRSWHKTQYEVVDKEKEANEFLAKRVLKRKAVDIAEGLSGENLIDMARNLGLDPSHHSVPTLHKEIIEIAEKNHKRFMDIWDSPNRVQLTTLKRALATGVVTEEPSMGFMYGQLPLGYNEALAVDYLREHSNVAIAIEQKARNQEAASIKAMAKKETPAVFDDKRDASVTALMEELKKANEMIKHLSSLAAKKQIEEEGSQEPDTEFEALKVEAKGLGFKNPNIYKTKEKLQEAVNKKKAEIA